MPPPVSKRLAPARKSGWRYLTDLARTTAGGRADASASGPAGAGSTDVIIVEGRANTARSAQAPVQRSHRAELHLSQAHARATDRDNGHQPGGPARGDDDHIEEVRPLIPPPVLVTPWEPAGTALSPEPTA